MFSKLDLVFFVAVVGVLFVSKPTQADIEREIKAAIFADINAAQLNKDGDFLPNLATLACKVDAESCYKLARAAIQVSYKDRIVFAAVGIHSTGRKRNCVGAFKHLFCPDFLN